MPMYEFQCPNCSVVTTELCRMGDKGESLMCSECGLTGLTKQISGFASLGVSGAAGIKSCSSGCSGKCTGCH